MFTSTSAVAVSCLPGLDPEDSLPPITPYFVMRVGRLPLADYAMPGMTGLQLMHHARELKPELRVLLATGYAEFPDGSITDVPRLAKPFMQEQLATQIAKVFGH